MFSIFKNLTQKRSKNFRLSQM